MVERFSTCVYFDANSKNSGLCASSELFPIFVHILHFKDDQLWIYNSYIHHCDHSTELTKRYVKLWNWLINFSQFFIHKFFGFLYSLIVSAIECWRCSSDAANADYCNDPSEANVSQTKHGYVECEKSSDESIRRVVCKKVKKLSTLARNL